MKLVFRVPGKIACWQVTYISRYFSYMEQKYFYIKSLLTDNIWNVAGVNIDSLMPVCSYVCRLVEDVQSLICWAHSNRKQHNKTEWHAWSFFLLHILYVHCTNIHSRASLLLKYTPEGAHTREIQLYAQYIFFSWFTPRVHYFLNLNA